MEHDCNGHSSNKYISINCKQMPVLNEASCVGIIYFRWKLIVHFPHAMFSFHIIPKTAKRQMDRIAVNIRLHSYCIFLKRLNCFPSLCRNVYFLWLLSKAAAQVRASCFAGQWANQRVLKFFHVLFNKTVPPQIQPVTSFDPAPTSSTVIIGEGCPPVVLMENKNIGSLTGGQQVNSPTAVCTKKFKFIFRLNQLNL